MQEHELERAAGFAGLAVLVLTLIAGACALDYAMRHEVQEHVQTQAVPPSELLPPVPDEITPEEPWEQPEPPLIEELDLNGLEVDTLPEDARWH